MDIFKGSIINPSVMGISLSGLHTCPLLFNLSPFTLSNSLPNNHTHPPIPFSPSLPGRLFVYVFSFRLLISSSTPSNCLSLATRGTTSYASPAIHSLFTRLQQNRELSQPPSQPKPKPPFRLSPFDWTPTLINSTFESTNTCWPLIIYCYLSTIVKFFFRTVHFTKIIYTYI